MIGSYLKTSGRSLWRNRLFSFINVAGLAVSMSVGLLLISLLTDMTSYDRFHEKGNRIYRVITKYSYLNQEDDSFFASTSPMAAKEIKESLPGLEDAAILHGGLDSDVKAGDKVVPLSGFWADASMFNVFSFEVVKGHAATALKEPFQVVLTESAAKKLFGEQEALGKEVIMQSEQAFTVSAIMKDVPKFSHMRFDMLASYSTRAITEKERMDNEMKWDNIWQGYAYLLLPPTADLQNVQAYLDRMCQKNDQTVENTRIQIKLQPLFQIALGEDHSNAIGPVMSKTQAWMIGILALVVILSACFNYTNLTIARATRRSREVGIRKVIGALRSHVWGQFVIEALVVSLISLLFALLMFALIRPYFLSMQPELTELLDLRLSPVVVLYFVLFALVVGLVAGFVPAWLYARINALQVLKDNKSVKLFRHLNLRKVLLVTQYAISLMFIAATFIGLRQYRHFVNFDLGYNTENILNITLKGNRADLLVKELEEMPEVQGVSRSLIVTSVGNNWGDNIKYNDPLDSSSVSFNGIDEHYIPLHDIKLAAGRNFTPLPDSAQESEVIVNDEVLKRFNVAGGDPQRAIDEILVVDGKPMKIIGVLKDYHYGRANSKKSPVILRYMKKKARFVNVKLVTNDWMQTLAKVENAWKKIDQVHALEVQLYKDRLKHSYRELSSMVQMMSFLGFLTICIASLGMLGMVVFVTETRAKEISIRKVLGASEAMLIFLMSRSFISLLFISGAIALPATYLFFEEVALPEMHNHAPVAWSDLLIGFGAVLGIAMLMIGAQTFKAARTNPADTLRSE